MAKTIHRNDYLQLVAILRDRRESMGVSQSALARELGWTQQRISYIEKGIRRMDVLEFIGLARALGVSPLSALRRAERFAVKHSRK